MAERTVAPRGPVAWRRVALRVAVVAVAIAVGLVVLRLTDSPVRGLTRSDAVDTDGLAGTLLSEPYALATGTLTDTEGAPFEVLEELDAPLTLLFFGYTHCEDTCPAVLATITSALARLDADEASQVEMWFVTTDPARDTPEELAGYLGRFDPSYTGLTGSSEVITEVAGSVHVAIEAGRRLPSGGYDVLHGTPVLAVQPDGTVPVLWTEHVAAADLAADLHTVLADGLPSAAPEEGAES